MMRFILAVNIVCLLIFGGVCDAGTWLDSFDDGDLWLQWRFLDADNTEIELYEVTEENGRLVVPVQPGTDLYMSAGEFQGDIEFRALFPVPPIMAEGSVGIVLRQAPWEPGDAQVHIRLDHKPRAENTNFVAGDGVGEDSKSIYTAITSISFQIGRTGSEVVALVTEDEEEPQQLGSSYLIPEGTVEALLQFSAPEGVDPWNAQVEEVTITGEMVEDRSAQAGASGEQVEGRPFVANQAGILANQGFRALRNGQLDQALQLYSQAQSIMPKRYEPFFEYLRDDLAPRIRAEGFDSVLDEQYHPNKETTIREWLGK